MAVGTVETGASVQTHGLSFGRVGTGGRNPPLLTSCPKRNATGADRLSAATPGTVFQRNGVGEAGGRKGREATQSPPITLSPEENEGRGFRNERERRGQPACDLPFQSRLKETPRVICKSQAGFIWARLSQLGCVSNSTGVREGDREVPFPKEIIKSKWASLQHMTLQIRAQFGQFIHNTD